MDERISVGTSFNNGWFIGSIVMAALCLVGGLALLAFHPEPAYALLGLGALLGLIAIVHGISISRGRKWFTSTAEGFVYEDRRGTFVFNDGDIAEMGTWAKQLYNNGVPKSVQRDCRLVLEAGEIRGDFQFSYRFPNEKIDPNTEFLERNLQRLTDEAVERIAKGEALVGETWELDSRELLNRVGRKNETYALDELAAVDVVDNKTCIWIRGEAKPAVQVPAVGLNALVLVRVLAKRFQDRGNKTDDEAGLGRIIFERDNSIAKGVIAFTFILGGLMVLGAFVAAYFATQERDPTGPIILTGVLALLGLGIPALVWFNRINILRCHTKGVCRMTTRTHKELEYKDIRVFSYGAIRQYVNGAYTGTTVTMSFEPAEGADGDAIKYSATMKKIDGELDNLREHVSQVIASNMKGRLDRGESVRWTEGLTFAPEGLQVEVAGGILSKAKSRKIAYVNLLFSLQDGYFYLFKKGGKDAIYTLPVSASNFFPGFMLVNQLSYEANQKAAEPKAEAAEEAPEE